MTFIPHFFPEHQSTPIYLCASPSPCFSLWRGNSSFLLPSNFWSAHLSKSLIFLAKLPLTAIFPIWNISLTYMFSSQILIPTLWFLVQHFRAGVLGAFEKRGICSYLSMWESQSLASFRQFFITNLPTYVHAFISNLNTSYTAGAVPLNVVLILDEEKRLGSQSISSFHLFIFHDRGELMRYPDSQHIFQVSENNTYW